ncbi:histone-lysine N-methyltransferase SETMAR [Trichonephila clavipes]|nr:histone-lysine N-methyltransferase SETMAR [Trichonephila clavipes]
MDSAINTQNLIRSFGWEQIDHPPYSPDMAQSDFRLFRYLKEFLGGKRFDTADEVKEEVQDWLSSQAADVYENRHSGTVVPAGTQVDEVPLSYLT